MGIIPTPLVPFAPVLGDVGGTPTVLIAPIYRLGRKKIRGYWPIVPVGANPTHHSYGEGNFIVGV